MCMDGRGLRKAVIVNVFDRRVVIESDQAAIKVEMEWNGGMRPRKKKKKKKKKKEKLADQTEIGRVLQTDE